MNLSVNIYKKFKKRLNTKVCYVHGIKKICFKLNYKIKKEREKHHSYPKYT
jgi:hypothetical protein